MATLGILEEQTIEGELLSIFQNNGYEIAFVGNKEQLSQVDGIVLPITNKEAFPPLVDWLIACQTTPSVFVWVFSTIHLDVERDILMSLGANDVVMSEAQLPRLSLLVKNTFFRLAHAVVTNTSHERDSLLNPKNQSVWINQAEQTLTRKEYQLLDLLYENRGNCVLYDTLIETLWPNSQNQELYNLTNTIFHLREKMKQSEEIVIRTIRSKGYMLVTQEIQGEE